MRPEPALSLDVLLVHRDFLTGLSRSLLANRQDADDLAQETWLAALKHPPSHDSNVRGWFKTVASHFVSSDGRRRTGRARREAAVAPRDTTPSAEEISDREAARREVVEAVLALEDTYRDPVVLRYYEDLPPREIARRLGVPVETVRTRLKRALQQMRSQMDAGRGGDRAAWSVALMPIAWPGASASAATAVTVGAALGARRLLWVAGLLFVASLPVAYVWQREAPPISNAAANPPAGEVAAVIATNLPAGGMTGISDETTVSRDLVESTPSLRIQGVVRRLDGTPVGRAEVAAIGIAFRDGSLLTNQSTDLTESRNVIRAFADDQGRYSLGPIEPGVYELIARSAADEEPARVPSIGLAGVAVVGDQLLDRPESSTMLRALGDTVLAVRLGAPGALDISLDDPLAVAGRVVDDQGRALAGATVACVLPSAVFGSLPMPFGDLLEFLGPFAQSMTAGPDGTFQLSLVDGASLAARKDGYFALTQTVKTADRDLDARVIQLSPIPRFVFRGRVQDPAGRPIASAEVFLAHADDSSRSGLIDLQTTLFDEVEELRTAKRPVTRTLGDGSFELSTTVSLDDDPWAAAPTSWHRSLRLVAAAPGHLPDRSALLTPDTDAPDAPGARLLVLGAIQKLAGVVIDDASGARISGAAVTTQYDVDGDGFPFTIASTVSDAEGNFVVSAPVSDPLVRVELDGFVPWIERSRPRRDGEALVIEVKLKRVAMLLRGQVVDLEGAPLARMLTTPHDILGEISTSFYDVFAFDEDPRRAFPIGDRFDALMAVHGGTQAQIESGGAFQIQQRAWPNGAAWLMLTVNDQVHEIREVRPETGDILFRVNPEDGRAYSTLTLLATTARGESVDRLSFDIFRKGDRSWVTHAYWVNRNQATAMVREEGVFDVIARSDGHGRTILRDVHLPMGARVGPIEVTLSDERRLIGQVVLPGNDRTPAAGALVQVFTEDGLRLYSMSAAADGTFEVTGLGSGRVFVTATAHQLGAASIWVPIDRIGDNPTTLTIDGRTWLEVGLSEFAEVDMTPRVNLTVLDESGFVRNAVNAQLYPWHATQLFLPEGRYRLRSDGVGTRTFEVDFEIAGEGATRIDWDLFHDP